jgi:hypothetical protein
MKRQRFFPNKGYYFMTTLFSHLPKNMMLKVISILVLTAVMVLFWPIFLGAWFVSKVKSSHIAPVLKILLIVLILAFSLIAGFFWAKQVYAISSPFVKKVSQASIPSTIQAPLAPTPTLTSTSAASFGVITKTTGCQEQNGLPDTGCTPGALNPNVTQDTIASTICVSGYTATIRPAASYTTDLKIQQIKAYGYSDTSTSGYEEDHLVSLELGGAPADPANLWPEPHVGYYTAAQKDSVENYLHAQVCSHSLSLSQAQLEIANNWVAVYVARSGSPSISAGADNDDNQSTNPTATSTPTPQSGATDTNPPVKMSDSHICHALGDKYYDTTTHFTPFASMANCVAAGGKSSQ